MGSRYIKELDRIFVDENIKKGIGRVLYYMKYVCDFEFRIEIPDELFDHFFIYCQRIMQKMPNFVFQTDRDVYLFVICIFNLALKMNIDLSILNTSWTMAMTATLEEFNKYEIEMIQILGWNLAITNEQLSEFQTTFSLICFTMKEKKRKFSEEEVLPETPQKKVKKDHLLT
jgi:hypothetical protein